MLLGNCKEKINPPAGGLPILQLPWCLQGWGNGAVIGWVPIYFLLLGLLKM